MLEKLSRLDEQDYQAVNSEATHLTRTVNGMGTQGAMELLYALGTWLNENVIDEGGQA